MRAAYISAVAHDKGAQDPGKTDKVTGELLDEARQKIAKKDYSGAMATLAAVVPAQCAEFEYLFHYTLGCAAENRGLDRVIKTTGTGTVGELCKQARNDADCQRATASFRKSIKLNSGFSPAYQHLAECLSREGRFAEAYEVADRLVARVPRCATAYRLRGGFHTELNRHLEALGDFETAAELGPNDPETYWEIAQVSSSLGEYAKAVIAYDAAIRLDSPITAGCHGNMGLAYERMGKYEQALACFEKAKSLGFIPEWCDEHIAECRARLR